MKQMILGFANPDERDMLITSDDVIERLVGIGEVRVRGDVALIEVLIRDEGGHVTAVTVRMKKGNGYWYVEAVENFGDFFDDLVMSPP